MEIKEFLTAATLEAIDWGVLDLSNVAIEKRHALQSCEFLLTWELRQNYRSNSCGIFRVRREEKVWVYSDRITLHEFHASSLEKLEEKVLDSDNIWYVFDEELTREVI